MTYPQSPSAVDLVFEKPSSITNPLEVNLVFGETSGPPVDAEYEAIFNARFNLRGAVAVNYDIAVWRGVTSSIEAPHQTATEMRRAISNLWQPSQKAEHQQQAEFSDGKRLDKVIELDWSIPLTAEQARGIVWQQAAAAEHTAEADWRSTTPANEQHRSAWQEGLDLSTSSGLRFGLAKASPATIITPWEVGAPTGASIRAPLNRAGKPAEHLNTLPWQQARTLASYGGRRYLPPPRPEVPVKPPVVQDLKFCALYPEGGNPASGLTLVFGFNPCGSVTPDAPLYILPARVYMSVHSIEAYLHPSGTPVPIFDLNLAADIDSTVWTFSASAPASYFEALMPVARQPQRLRFVVNGLEWVMLVETLQERTVFGQRRAMLGGRSVTALLGDPYASITDRLSTVANTAQQHALDALQFSGVTLDWDVTDWLVPAGAWSHSGTPLEAVQAIAQGIGGFINSHRTLPELIVRHPYPTLPGGIPGGPWNWEGAAGSFAADVELAPEAIRERSVERMDGPDVDGVWVSGTVAGGVERHVRRAGTLGAKLAPMSANPLITAEAAASQLGYSIIGLAGSKHKVSLTLPVRTGPAEPGVLEVGQLVQVNDLVPWRGRVRGVNVTFTAPRLIQTVTLERHLML